MLIKMKLLELGKKQVDLLDHLRKEYGFTVNPPELSQALSGKDQNPKAARLREASLEIIDKWKEEQKNGI